MTTSERSRRFPIPAGDTPGGNQLIWSFMTGTPLAPVPS